MKQGIRVAVAAMAVVITSGTLAIGQEDYSYFNELPAEQVSAANPTAISLASDATTFSEADFTGSDFTGSDFTENDFALCDDGCGKLFGFIERSESRYDDFISPMTNPVFFEDPRTLSEVRAIFIQHQMPSAYNGANVQVYALQMRAAFNDRWSIVAAKDGYIVAESDAILDDGWADVSAGLKYNLFSDPEAGRLLSTGFGLEMPTGSTRALQGNGGGEFNIYLTGATRLGCNWHWISATGFRLPVDSTEETQRWFWSNHLDYQMNNCWYVFGEVNWYHWMKSGGGGIDGVEGIDLFNLGSTGVAGDNVAVGAIGLKYKPSNRTEIGLAWEMPLTDLRYLLGNRITADWIIRY